MAPVATENHNGTTGTNGTSTIEALKKDAQALFNPFYSPSVGDDGNEDYPFTQYKVSSFHTPCMHSPV
jgi:sulfonate dioxygenase